MTTAMRTWALSADMGQWTPTGLGALATGTQSISVTWDAMGAATGYTLDRAASPNGPWTQVYSGSTVHYTDTGLQFGTTYCYEVCDNNSGSTSFSPSVSATTLPGVPTGLAAAAAGSQSISIIWNTVSGATTYTLQRSTSANGTYTTVYSGSTPSYADSGLQPATTYYYEVSSGNSSGSSPYSSAVSATPSPTVTISSPGNNMTVTTFPLTITGTATDIGGAGLSNVTVANTANGSTAAEIVSGTSASYSIGGITLVPGSNVIDVESFDKGGYSSTVATVTVTYSPSTWIGAGALSVNWSTAANWGGTTLAAGNDLVFAGSTGLSNTNDLAAGTSFGNLTFSSTAGPFTLSGNSIGLSGVITNDSTNTETINLPLGGTNGLTKTGPGTVVLTAANTYSGSTAVLNGILKIANLAALPTGTNLIVGANAVVAFDPINNSGSTSFSPSVSATTLPGVPTSLAATATGSQPISVGWTVVTGAASNTLQRSNSANGTYTPVYSVSTASCSDSGLPPNIFYAFPVNHTFWAIRQFSRAFWPPAPAAPQEPIAIHPQTVSKFWLEA